jgi:hypothetical protein
VLLHYHNSGHAKDHHRFCLQESYIYVFLANLFSSLYAVFINVTKKETGLDVFGMLYYNYLLLLPLVSVLAVTTTDLEDSLAFPALYDLGFQISFQASVVLAFFLNVSAFYCTILNSARTKTVTGCLKSFFTMILGLYLFSDYVYDPINFFGLAIGFVGSVWYSVLTYADKPPASPSKLAVKSHTSSAAEMIGIGSPTPSFPEVVVETRMQRKHRVDANPASSGSSTAVSPMDGQGKHDV